MGLVSRIKNRLLRNEELFKSYQWAEPSFSQAAEDMVLMHLFADKENGTFVDVGAYDPIRMSNTYYFYATRGWRGINLDANKYSIEKFKKERPEDQSFNYGVGQTEEIKEFYIFDSAREGYENSMNSFLGEKYDKTPKEKIEVPIKPLAKILEENYKGSGSIDFLSVDVEGMELEVLKSNDWDKFRAKVLVIECLDTFVRNSSVQEIMDYIESKGYKTLFKLPLSFIFIESSIKLTDINQIHPDCL